MTTWSQPYLTVTPTGGPQRKWTPPAPGLPAGDLDLPGLGLPAEGRIAVRWRGPGSRNARHATFTVTDPAWADLVRDLHAARVAAGAGWRADERGRPVRDTRRQGLAPIPPVPAPPVAVAPPAPVEPVGLLEAERRVWASPHNLVLAEVAAGRYGLGPTVADLVEDLKAARYAGSGPKNKSNISSVLSILKHVMTYREPHPDEPAEVREWKAARLELPGVELGGSMHVRLLLVRDLDDAIEMREHVDFRVEAFNTQAVRRHQQDWERYLRAVQAKRDGTWRGGRLPHRPPDEVELREQPPQTKARTEQLFAQQLAAVLRIAESRGHLVGPNPWRAFTGDPTRRRGYRIPRSARVNERIVPPLGAVVALADQIATLGPADPERGCPTGQRFRALVLTGATAPRPAELCGLAPEDYVPGDRPHLLVRRSLTHVSPELNDGSSIHLTDAPKARSTGEVRKVELPRAVADALDAHLAAGYASAEFLFTGPDGGPLNLAAIAEVYWRPAVTAVLGHSRTPQLAHMPFRWLRKAGITWMLRSGKTLAEVADIVGNSSTVIEDHYAGVVPGEHERRAFTTWDDAWAWAAQETTVR